MKSFTLLFLVAMLGIPGTSGQVSIASAYARCRLSLNGTWNVIVDPYETGFFDYRHQPFDENPNSKDGFYLDRTPASPSVLAAART